MIAMQNISNWGPTQKTAAEANSNLDFHAFLAEVGAIYIMYFCNQMESDEIYIDYFERVFSFQQLFFSEECYISCRLYRTFLNFWER